MKKGAGLFSRIVLSSSTELARRIVIPCESRDPPRNSGLGAVLCRLQRMRARWSFELHNSYHQQHQQHQQAEQPKMHSTVLFFLQLCLAMFAFAAPIAEETFTTTSNSVGYGTGGGIVGLIILVLDILVFSTSISPTVYLS